MIKKLSIVIAGIFLGHSFTNHANANPDYYILCGGHIANNAVLIFESPRPGDLSINGRLNYDDADRALKCVYHFDFSKSPQPDVLTKNWSCVDEDYLQDPQGSFFNGFYYVELFSAGLTVEPRADISFVELGVAHHLNSESCSVFPLRL